MLVSHDGLVELVNRGVVENVTPDLINAASIDLTLGNGFSIESTRERVVDLSKGDSIGMQRIESDSLILRPGDWCLATTQQRFNMPDNMKGFIKIDERFCVASEYKLKSSMARNGLNHLLAGWADPGWHGSELTLELHNINRYHSLKLTAGMKIGQMVFWMGEPVPQHASYASKGRYNNQTGATESLGVL